jgi:two-component system sensor histidine kinase KdpD
LEQVLVNLLLNACHHTPPGSPIDISAGQEDRAGKPWLFLRVTDHGPGLPEDWPAKLFRKFSRGATAQPGGLGLGLSIVRGFMQAQGGDVTAANTSGGGASFTLYLPHMLHGNVPDDEN